MGVRGSALKNRELKETVLVLEASISFLVPRACPPFLPARPCVKQEELKEPASLVNRAPMYNKLELITSAVF